MDFSGFSSPIKSKKNADGAQRFMIPPLDMNESSIIQGVIRDEFDQSATMDFFNQMASENAAKRNVKYKQRSRSCERKRSLNS